MKSSKYLALILACGLSPITYTHADNAVLIGGGYNINGSQGQIELNVRWVQDVLKKTGMPVTTYFTDGDDPAPDVHYLLNETNAEQASNTEPTSLDALATQIEPLARLYNEQSNNTKRFRNHEVPDVSGSTEAQSLSASLSEHFKASPNDPTLIVYNGHGKQSKTTTDNVTMELWNNTAMTANELHGILDESNAPSRFVFTQCYSGGFHRLAYANPAKGLTLSSNKRCGFTAESAYRLAEGCSASVDTEDYRDYTTYFFAALSGYQRNGKFTPGDADTNGDGQVGLREAHLYTLANAHSSDLSRSTSEDYLSTWQPWFLKWAVDDSGLPSNEYGKLFRDLAGKHNITLHKNSARDVRAELAKHEKTISDLAAKRKNIESELNNIQRELKTAASSKWPALSEPFTANFQIMAASGELVEVANWIKDQPAYDKMVELQNQNNNITNLKLEALRNLTQMQKLIEFRRLAKLKKQLYQYGSQDQIESYESLVSCEEEPLNSTSATLNTSGQQLTEQNLSD